MLDTNVNLILCSVPVDGLVLKSCQDSMTSKHIGLDHTIKCTNNTSEAASIYLNFAKEHKDTYTGVCTSYYTSTAALVQPDSCAAQRFQIRTIYIYIIYILSSHVYYMIIMVKSAKVKLGEYRF